MSSRDRNLQTTKLIPTSLWINPRTPAHQPADETSLLAFRSKIPFTQTHKRTSTQTKFFAFPCRSHHPPPFFLLLPTRRRGKQGNNEKPSHKDGSVAQTKAQIMLLENNSNSLACDPSVGWEDRRLGWGAKWQGNNTLIDNCCHGSYYVGCRFRAGPETEILRG